MIYVLATVAVRPEHRADFLENARTVISATVKEPGCHSYDLMSSPSEKYLVVGDITAIGGRCGRVGLEGP